MENRLTCTNRREHQSRWWVLERRCNYSAFNGYRRTPSDYSLVGCKICGVSWRTRAAYVDDLPEQSWALIETANAHRNEHEARPGENQGQTGLSKA